jgi:hypothetical protein
MSTDQPRRVALVLAAASAEPAAPPGVDPAAFARACLADTYEVVADLVGVASGIVGPPDVADLLWPRALHLPAAASLAALAAQLTPDFDELVLLPADVPDLPGLVLAKLFKVLHRVDLAVAPERTGPGCVALGIRLPAEIDLTGLDLDRVPASDRGTGRVAHGPDWHRLRVPADINRLDPGLEGWEETRALLSGHALQNRR